MLIKQKQLSWDLNYANGKTKALFMRFCLLKSFLYSYTNWWNKTRLIGAINYERVSPKHFH